MNKNTDTAFVIDIFDPLNKRANKNVVHKFYLHNRWYCIRETKLEWGQPILLNQSIEEEETPYFQVYASLEEAKAFAHKMRELEGIKL